MILSFKISFFYADIAFGFYKPTERVSIVSCNLEIEEAILCSEEYETHRPYHGDKG